VISKNQTRTDSNSQKVLELEQELDYFKKPDLETFLVPSMCGTKIGIRTKIFERLEPRVNQRLIISSSPSYLELDLIFRTRTRTPKQIY
jgi:hypothetical protein